jgi:hypothetical protein
MAIAVTVVNSEVVTGLAGVYFDRALLAVSGLTTNGANTIPHGLPRDPRRVVPIPVNSGGIGVLLTLDTSQGDATSALGAGHLGWDKTNIYIYIGNGPTDAMFLVDY